MLREDDMKYLRILAMTLALLTCLFSGGCGTGGFMRFHPQTVDAHIRLISEPEGATLYWGTNMYAKCPAVLTCPIVYTQCVAGSVSIALPAAVWPSGASVSETNGGFVVPIDGEVQNFVYHHPDVSGQRREYDGLRKYYIDLKVETQPKGAEIFYKNKSLGKAPANIVDRIDLLNYSNGVVNVEEVVAQWKSGARKTTHMIPMPVQTAYGVDIIITRPKDVANEEVDLDEEARIIWETSYAQNPPVVRIVIKSDPSGATLYDGDANRGQCPISVEHAITFDEFKTKVVSFTSLTTRWPSGVTKDTGPIKASWTNRETIELTCIRPAIQQGLEVDVNFAIEQQRINAEKLRLAEERERQQKLQEQQQRQYEESAARERERQQQIMAQQDAARKQQERVAILQMVQQDQYQQQLLQQQRQMLQQLRQNQPQFHYGSGTIIGPNGQSYQYNWNGQ